MTNQQIQPQHRELEMRKQSLIKIGEFCQNQKENDIVKAQQSVRIRDYDFNNAKHKTVITMVLTEWSFMIGTKEANTPEENLINAKFLIAEYEEVTVEEIRQAIKWSITGKLTVDANCYGKFSPMYIAKILNAYLNERDGVMYTLKRRWREDIWKKQWDEKNKPLPYEERVAESRKFLIRHLNDMKVKKVPDSAGGLCWKFLTRALQVDESQFDERINEYADAKIKMWQLSPDYMKVIKNMTKQEIKNMLELYKQGYMKDFVIWDWLEKVHNIEEFVSKQHAKLIVEA